MKRFEVYEIALQLVCVASGPTQGRRSLREGADRNLFLVEEKLRRISRSLREGADRNTG